MTMGVLSDLEPKRVFHYFEEITKIPHGSGNVREISDYLVNFAKEHKLSYIQDEFLNVIIFKGASIGYENEPTLMLQGHMDMVAVHTDDYDADMKKTPLEAAVDGDYIYAKGTSLGGDDGIAVAYALAILESDEIEHTPLEIIITAEEEVGMDGARGLDMSHLKGMRLLNLDSEKEGEFLTGCAGGGRVLCKLTLPLRISNGKIWRISIKGLKGGHSGDEIDKGRENSNVLMGRVLSELLDRGIKFELSKLSGGMADNAIAKSTSAVFILRDEEKSISSPEAVLSDIYGGIKSEICENEPDFCLLSEGGEEGSEYALDAGDTVSIIGMLRQFPQGVQAMSRTVPGLVETSLNMGILELKPDKEKAELKVTFSVRSSITAERDALIDSLKSIASKYGAITVVSGLYPGWEFDESSKLRKKMEGVYERLYGEKPKVRAIHAGLECGLLIEKRQGLDCVSIGPDMSGVHTTDERLSISSTRRVWNFLLELLRTRG